MSKRWRPTCNRQRLAAFPPCVSCKAFVAAYWRPSSIPLFLHSSSAGWTTATVSWSTCLSLTSSTSSQSTKPQQGSFSTRDVVTTSSTRSSVSPTCRTVAGSGPPPLNSLTFWSVGGRAFPVARGVDPMCFPGSGPTHFFRSWVRIGIGPTHFLRWIVNNCVCIYIDKSQMSFIELCKTLTKNSGLRAVNSFLRLQGLFSCFSKHCFVTAEFKIVISPADCGVWTHTELRPCLLLEPAKRCYIGLVAVGVQKQAEDIRVPPLLRNCLTVNYISVS